MSAAQDYSVRQIDIPGPHGPVPTRTYIPIGPHQNGVVWVHGGGFRVGDLDMPEADWAARYLAARGITVASVGYRLAVGGVHYPVPVDDVLAAWEWVQSDAAITSSGLRWSIGGGSAGATISQSVAMRLLRDGETLPARVALIYPGMHARMPEAPAELVRKRRVMPPGLRFDGASVEEHGLNYAGTVEQMAKAFPGEAATSELIGLPPTLIVNSDLDDLRASGQRFAAQLIEAGVDVAVIRELGVFHGHLAFPSFPQAATTMSRVAEWVTTSAIPGSSHTDDRDGWALPNGVPTIWEQDAIRRAAELASTEGEE